MIHLRVQKTGSPYKYRNIPIPIGNRDASMVSHKLKSVLLESKNVLVPQLAQLIRHGTSIYG